MDVPQQLTQMESELCCTWVDLMSDDGTTAYNELATFGGGAMIVMHNENFVHPVHPEIHIKSIESLRV